MLDGGGILNTEDFSWFRNNRPGILGHFVSSGRLNPRERFPCLKVQEGARANHIIETIPNLPSIELFSFGAFCEVVRFLNV